MASLIRTLSERSSRWSSEVLAPAARFWAMASPRFVISPVRVGACWRRRKKATSRMARMSTAVMSSEILALSELPTSRQPVWLMRRSLRPPSAWPRAPRARRWRDHAPTPRDWAPRRSSSRCSPSPRRRRTRPRRARSPAPAGAGRAPGPPRARERALLDGVEHRLRGLSRVGRALEIRPAELDALPAGGLDDVEDAAERSRVECPGVERERIFHELSEGRRRPEDPDAICDRQTIIAGDPQISHRSWTRGNRLIFFAEVTPGEPRYKAVGRFSRPMERPAWAGSGSFSWDARMAPRRSRTSGAIGAARRVSRLTWSDMSSLVAAR